jgi:hypothetical protein
MYTPCTTALHRTPLGWAQVIGESLTEKMTPWRYDWVILPPPCVQGVTLARRYSLFALGLKP